MVRYGIGATMILAGIVVLIVSPGGFGVDGFAMAVGGGLSVLLINYMYRLSLDSNRDRDEEEAARNYLAEHGRWPDEQPGPHSSPGPRGSVRPRSV